eukprot:1704757-Pleurochrysis_carterae.AAC.3
MCIRDSADEVVVRGADAVLLGHGRRLASRGEERRRSTRGRRQVWRGARLRRCALGCLTRRKGWMQPMTECLAWQKL